MTNLIKKTYKIDGMDCSSCAMVIESDLEDAGIKAKCDFATSELKVELKDKTNHEKVKEIVKNSGYKIEELQNDISL